MTRSVPLIIVTLGALSAFTPLAVDMYLPALPALAEDFAADAGQVQLTLSVFMAGMAGGQLLYGPVSDRFGRKLPLLAGALLFVAASLGCALAPGLDALIGLRLLQALGGCAGVVIARAMVRDLFAPQEAARVFSLLMLVTGIAPIVAPLIGGYLLTWFGWPSIFVMLAGTGALALVAAQISLPETRPAGGRLTLGSALRSYGLLFTDRNYVGFALSNGLSMGSLFTYIAGSPFVFISLFGLPAEQFGWLFGANACAILMAAQVNRRLLRRYGAASLLTAGSAIAAVAALVLVVFAAGGAGIWGIAPPLTVVVAMTGMVLPNGVACAMASQGERAGSAAALLGSLQYLCGGTAVTLLGLWPAGSAVPMATTMAACAVTGFTTRLLVTRRPAP
ncbi:Bcr/CflA family multidrug efflux MFS transporter [Ferrovibrio xuzhouensis]|uniref:Bcr/CflA family efflux transporter n=1 Tax=Ferrovibrio xuzhouensis TaxID=1576914 RepID=A0ABV7VGV0_9PROT